MNKSILLLFFIFSSINLFGQLWTDDFDGSNTSNPVELNTNLPPNNVPCNVNGDAFFGVMCDFGAGCGPGTQGEISSAVSDTYAPGTFQGNFIGALDSDNLNGCGIPNSAESELVEWFDIDITSCTPGAPMYLCMDIATGTDAPGEGWDNVLSRVTIGTRIDEPFPGASFSIIAQFVNQGSANTPGGLDTNCDGIGDDELLTNSFVNYCFVINGSGGTSLDIQIKIRGLNESSEDIAIDNVSVWCETPPTAVLDICGGPCSSDFDCDGVLQFEDCDDNDAFVTAARPTTCFVSISECDDGTGFPSFDLTSIQNMDCFDGNIVEWFIEPSGFVAITDPSDHRPPNPFQFEVYAQLTSAQPGGCPSPVFAVELIVVAGGCTDPEASNFDPNAVCDDGSCLDPLPIEMTFFNAVLVGNDVELKWQTSSEQDNLGFEIQRSRDGINWENIGFEKGNGNTSSITDYQWMDQKVSSGRYYYQLKDIAFDGSFTFSEIVSVYQGKESLIEIFPNPTNGLTSIIGLGQDQEVALLDWEGRILTPTIGDGQIDLSQLDAGIYFIKITNTEKVLIKKVVKLNMR